MGMSGGSCEGRLRRWGDVWGSGDSLTRTPSPSHFAHTRTLLSFHTHARTFHIHARTHSLTHTHSHTLPSHFTHTHTPLSFHTRTHSLSFPTHTHSHAHSLSFPTHAQSPLISHTRTLPSHFTHARTPSHFPRTLTHTHTPSHFLHTHACTTLLHSPNPDWCLGSLTANSMTLQRMPGGVWRKWWGAMKDAKGQPGRRLET